MSVTRRSTRSRLKNGRVRPCGRRPRRTRAGSRRPSAAARAGRATRPSASVSAWVIRIGRPSSREPVEGHVDADRRHPAFGVEDVGRDGRDRGDVAPSATLSSARWERCGSIVGDLHFSARWEAAAPRTIEAIRRMLPIESKLIHCRWTGESTWIPFGDFRPGLDYENHTSHPAPGQLAIYPGGISECEIFFPYGGCTTASKVGPAGGQPLRDGGAPTRAGTTGCARWAGAACGRARRRSRSARSRAEARPAGLDA